jgi:hypothetical protein
VRVKPLELIQAIVTRIANYHAATLKNYCITLATAIARFAVAAVACWVSRSL